MSWQFYRELKFKCFGCGLEINNPLKDKTEYLHSYENKNVNVYCLKCSKVMEENKLSSLEEGVKKAAKKAAECAFKDPVGAVDWGMEERSCINVALSMKKEMRERYKNVN